MIGSRILSSIGLVHASCTTASTTEGIHAPPAGVAVHCVGVIARHVPVRHGIWVRFPGPWWAHKWGIVPSTSTSWASGPSHIVPELMVHGSSVAAGRKGAIHCILPRVGSLRLCVVLVVYV